MTISLRPKLMSTDECSLDAPVRSMMRLSWVWRSGSWMCCIHSWTQPGHQQPIFACELQLNREMHESKWKGVLCVQRDECVNYVSGFIAISNAEWSSSNAWKCLCLVFYVWWVVCGHLDNYLPCSEELTIFNRIFHHMINISHNHILTPF